jgi:pimeloyl-ACP methyl ester carboxylesterase
MTPVYIFSGLGTDERVFQYIDFSGFDIHHISWIAPLKDETIESYAKRIIGQIHDGNPVLIGVSFGGIIAVEVAKLIPTEKIILISSVKTRHELPFYYRLAGTLHLHKLLPLRLLKHPNLFAYWLFGAKERQYKDLLAAILCDTDNDFLKWALDAVATWRNEYKHTNLVHLHGTADRILPYRFIKKAIRVPAGGHFMIVDQATLLTNMLRNLLSISNITS